MRHLFRHTGNPRILQACLATHPWQDRAGHAIPGTSNVGGGMMPDLVEHDLVVSGSLDEAGQVDARPSHASSSLLRPPDI